MEFFFYDQHQDLDTQDRRAMARMRNQGLTSLDPGPLTSG